MTHRRQALRRIATLSISIAAGAGTRAWAQADKTVTIVVPYAPGGTTDMLGRLLAQQLGAALKRTVVVDNRPGAGTAIGAQQVAHAAPDGSSLLVATSTTLAINPWLYKKLPYDPVRDFAPVALLGAVPLVVVVHPSVKAESLADLVALAKADPKALSYGSAGNGSPQHLGAEMFKAACGVELTHVPYKGSSLAMADLLGGQIQLMFIDIAPALQQVRAGKLRALAVTSAKRQPVLPEVPTVAQTGVPGTAGFEAVAWQSVVAPAGMPAELVDRLSSAIEKIIAQPEFRQRLEREGFEPEYRGPAPLAAYVQSESKRWGVVVKASGTQID